MEGPALGWVGIEGKERRLGTEVYRKSFIREGKPDLHLERRARYDGWGTLRSCSGCRDSRDKGTREGCRWRVWLSDVCIFAGDQCERKLGSFGEDERIIKTWQRSLKLIGQVMQSCKFLFKEMTQWHDIYISCNERIYIYICSWWQGIQGGWSWERWRSEG